MLMATFLPVLAAVDWIYRLMPAHPPYRLWFEHHPFAVGLTCTIAVPAALLGGVFAASAMSGATGASTLSATALLLVWICTALLTGAGYVYADQSAKGVRTPKSTRLFRHVAPASSEPAYFGAATQQWSYLLLQAGIVIALCLAVTPAISHYEAAREPQGYAALLTIVGCAIAGYLAFGVAWRVVDLARSRSSCLALLSAVHFRLAAIDLAVGNDELGKLVGENRRDLVCLTRRITKVSWRTVDQRGRHPADVACNALVATIDRYLSSPASVDLMPASLVDVLRDLGSLLVGGCEPREYRRILEGSNAFDVDGVPLSGAPRTSSRLARVASALKSWAEPTDKMLSTLTRLAAFTILIVLVVSGNLGLSEILENIK